MKTEVISLQLLEYKKIINALLQILWMNSTIVAEASRATVV